METFESGKLPENDFSSKLETMVKDFTTEISHCQAQAELWLERKKLLQTQMTDALQQIQKQFGIEQKASKKESTVPQLIREFLEKNGPARSREIRKFLLGLGRNTNPGVALGRLVAEGAIKNIERGVYSLS